MGNWLVITALLAASQSLDSAVPGDPDNHQESGTKTRKPEPITPRNWFPAGKVHACGWSGCPDGKVGFTLIVSAEGRVTDCAITRSSGSRRLDEVTCLGLLRYARFHPARDAGGRPVKGRYASTVTWAQPTSTEPEEG